MPEPHPANRTPERSNLNAETVKPNSAAPGAGDVPVADRPGSRLEGGRRWCDRNVALMAVLLLFTVGAAVWIALALISGNHPEGAKPQNEDVIVRNLLGT